MALRSLHVLEDSAGEEVDVEVAVFLDNGQCCKRRSLSVVDVHRAFVLHPRVGVSSGRIVQG